jgi:hypothetical protein
MTLLRKKTVRFAIYFLAIFVIIFCSCISISELVLAQTTLSQATTGFGILPFSFAFTSLIGKGVKDSFTASWIVQQSEPGLNTGVSCIFIGTSTVDCLLKPVIQGSGPGSCIVQTPPYDFTKLNNISCFVYYVPNSLFNATYNASFNPVSFNAIAGLGSLTVGNTVPLRVNIQNTGLLPDLYTVNFTSSSSYIQFSKPNTQTENLNGLPTNESGYAQSDVTAQAAFGTQTKITIQINSTAYPLIGQTITFGLTAGLASLPDFTIFGIIQIIILAALILWAKK